MILSKLSAEKLVLETERLTLRPIELDDAPLLWPHVSNPKISQYMSWNPHQSINQTIELIERLQRDLKNGKGITWSIFHKENEEFCGIFSIIAILNSHRDCIYDRGELACWCAPKYQIDRIMAESGKEVINFAFQVLRLNKLMNAHFTLNLASEKFMSGLGFHFIGEDHRSFKKNNVWFDTKTYELLNPNPD